MRCCGSTGHPCRSALGLNSGEVVVRTLGGDLHTNYAAVGQTVHLAARMEQTAKPGSIFATADTVRLARPWVEARSLGPVKVKGLESPVEVYEVIGVGAPRTRLQAAATLGLTRFVGREVEMGVLRAALDRIRSGESHVVGLVGEVGVGKSRLLREFVRAPGLGDCLVLESGSMAYGSATAYKPGVEILRRYFRIENGDDARVTQEKVAGKLLTLDRTLEDAVAPLLAVVGALPDESPFRTLAAAERRQRAAEAILRLMERESAIRPLALVFEDLQWAHQQTRRALDVVVGALPPRTLLIVSYRPEYDDGWLGRPNYTRIHVDPLAPATAQELLAALLGTASELVPLTGRLIERTEGNPLFLEECVRSLVETRALAGERGAYRLVAPPTALEIPANRPGGLGRAYRPALAGGQAPPAERRRDWRGCSGGSPRCARAGSTSRAAHGPGPPGTGRAARRTLGNGDAGVSIYPLADPQRGLRNAAARATPPTPRRDRDGHGAPLRRPSRRAP